ncbi:MAG TPA: hypothetical protein VG317_14075 [Pseudonocardiaceae bacterium]|jgi:hypothetical protein|nr:hypothetical protein [Pseudonocardiaceae bacterium]
MTEIERPDESGPSWSVDTLADLHAGVLDEPTATDLWPRVNADPQARAVLDALDAVRAELADLPPLTMPADVAARLDSALAAELGQPKQPMAPVVDLAAARSRRNRRLGWATGLVAAAAAVIGIGVVIAPGGGSPGSTVAGPPTGSTPTGTPLAISGPGQGGHGVSTALGAALARQDFGALAGGGQLSACLFANSVAPGVRPAGATPVVLDGRPAELLVLTTGRAAQFRLLVVGPSCGVDGAQKMADTVVGGLPSTLPSTAPTH